METEAILFDFDGVILESVDIKIEAFRKLFQDYPEHLNQIIEYHVQNGGISRFEKFKTIYRDFLKRELTEAESKKIGEKFSEFALQGVLKAPFVRGALEFLNKHYQKLLLFVVSGTPDEEMQSIIEYRGLRKFFKGVYGSPHSKFEIIMDILKEFNVKKSQVVFVGDSINDYEGASQAGIKFIGRVKKGAANPFLAVPLEGILEDLNSLEKFLTRQSSGI